MSTFLLIPSPLKRQGPARALLEECAKNKIICHANKIICHANKILPSAIMYM
jgi:hypothetical protein